MAKFGYIRTSTEEQNEARQIEAMQQNGVEKEYTFIEKKSGMNFEERPVYQEMKKRLTNVDVLYIESLSRLGRNREEVVQEFEWLNKNTTGLVVLNMPFLSTVDLNNTGVGKLIAKIFVEVIAWSDEEDRLEKKRMQKQGIAIAKRQGKYKGRKSTYTLNSPKVQHAFELLDSGNYTKKQVSELTSISTATLFRLNKERRKQKIEESNELSL